MSIKSFILSLASGLTSGLVVSFFLHTLSLTSSFLATHHNVILALPFAGAFIGWLYHSYGAPIEKGASLIVDEIHQPQKTIPFRMVPLVFISTALTHLFGGSAGREGAAVQMSASFSDQISRIFKINSTQRRWLLMASSGAGFGAALGTPWAGVLFGLEVLPGTLLQTSAWLECLVASWSAYLTTQVLGIHHTEFLNLNLNWIDAKYFFYSIILGLFFGLSSRLFLSTTHNLEFILKKIFPFYPLRAFTGGFTLACLFFWEGSFYYISLGLDRIQIAFSEASHFHEPIFKFILTAITLASGFKGGEFIPLVFMGSTLGSAISSWLPIPLGLAASLGFAALFASAARLPLTCTIMAMELFGYKVGLYALLCCLMSCLVSGQIRLYKQSEP